MSPRPRRALLLATALGLASTVLAGRLFAGPIETPAWDLVERGSGFEVREYEPRLEARVTTSGDTFQNAVSAGFRVLAAFIFGDNQTADSATASIAMTAPVSAARSTTIAMTAPVGAVPTARGEWVVSFVMPAQYTASTLPQPTDPRIRIVEVPAGRWAATTFRGQAARRHREATASLLSALRDAGMEPAGEPVVSQFDPPWIPAPLRKNEILVPLAAPNPESAAVPATGDHPAIASRSVG